MILIGEQGMLLANPILGALCQSFYEEKWQRALLVKLNRVNEWMTSITATMASFATTAVCKLLRLGVQSALTQRWMSLTTASSHGPPKGSSSYSCFIDLPTKVTPPSTFIQDLFEEVSDDEDDEDK